MADRPSSSREVNTLLHTLRGQQFRHAQNVLRSRTHITSLSNTHNLPTLPITLNYPSEEPEPEPDEALSSSTGTSMNRAAGPGPPKSWTLTSKSPKDNHDSPIWRGRALSVIFPRLQPPCFFHVEDQSQISVPPLSLLCLRILLSSFPVDEFIGEIVPFLPLHLRREIIRYTAVHSPLPNSKLNALCDPDGHANGELIVIGPFASLRGGHFGKGDRPLRTQPDHISNEDVTWDWESPLHDVTTSPPLHSLVLLSIHLSISNLLTLPPSITHLALVNLQSAIALHRLPALCPLLVLLDLSHNTWLSPSVKGSSFVLERVPWSRWNALQILGLRGSHVSEDLKEKVNKGRWDDVELIL